jgi:hypothetical protein
VYFVPHQSVYVSGNPSTEVSYCCGWRPARVNFVFCKGSFASQMSGSIQAIKGLMPGLACLNLTVDGMRAEAGGSRSRSRVDVRWARSRQSTRPRRPNTISPRFASGTSHVVCHWSSLWREEIQYAAVIGFSGKELSSPGRGNFSTQEHRGDSDVIPSTRSLELPCKKGACYSTKRGDYKSQSLQLNEESLE